MSFIKRDSDDFGLLFLGDSATIYRITLLKILVSGGKLPVSLLEPVDCQVHLAYGGKKDGSFICTIFLENIKKIDPHKSITDVFMFDGASNVQLDGELSKIKYPKVSVIRAVEKLYFSF